MSDQGQLYWVFGGRGFADTHTFYADVDPGREELAVCLGLASVVSVKRPVQRVHLHDPSPHQHPVPQTQGLLKRLVLEVPLNGFSVVWNDRTP